MEPVLQLGQWSVLVMYTLKSMYYAYFHSVTKCWIILEDNSSYSGSISLYKRKSSELWLLHSPEPHVEVDLINQEILPVPCQYILSLMNFIIYNQEKFMHRTCVNFMYTLCKQRNKHHLHRPNANLYCFQKSTFYAGIKIFNNLPPMGQWSRRTRQTFMQP